jgi:hypothetical protein
LFNLEVETKKNSRQETWVGSDCIAALILNLNTSWIREFNIIPWPFYNREIIPVSTEQEAG